jgi:hypothetical protein
MNLSGYDTATAQSWSQTLNPPASTPQKAGITGMYHHTLLRLVLFEETR